MTEVTPEEPGLFDAAPYQVVPEPAVKLGRDAARTQRALAVLLGGHHPVTRLPLHRDAPPVGDRQEPGPRCRTCGHLTVKRASRSYLKCGQNVTGGPATDIRAWWPACAAYEVVTGQQAGSRDA